jgi:hypothetical protein
MRNRRGIRALAAVLHDWESVARRCDAALAKISGQGLKGRVRHASTSPMGQHHAGASVDWPKPQG